tara:strand:- start:378 stop:1052 length:675 start_codon:yes stop_codon:yes gene_type:complete
MENHYSADYFNWQKNIGRTNIIHLTGRFSKFISKNLSVLDFGCGGGYLLNSLDCSYKIGYDVNKHAFEHLKELGINSCYNLSEIKENSIDVIISNSCLEHVPNPLESLKELKTKLKINGQIVFSVPHETIGYGYKPRDINYHLYTWSPMALGNLFNEAGFKNIKVVAYREIALPMENKLRGFIPMFILNILRKPYRIFRLILDELNIKRVGVDGNVFVSALNNN